MITSARNCGVVSRVERFPGGLCLPGPSQSRTCGTMQYTCSIFAWLVRRSAMLLLGCLMLLACGTAASSPTVAGIAPTPTPVPTATTTPARPTERPVVTPTAPLATVLAGSDVLSEQGVRVRADGALLVDGQPFFPYASPCTRSTILKSFVQKHCARLPPAASIPCMPPSA